jgi:hypothetical protein
MRFKSSARITNNKYFGGAKKSVLMVITAYFKKNSGKKRISIHLIRSKITEEQWEYINDGRFQVTSFFSII